jgi:hypothetical protein
MLSGSHGQGPMKWKLNSFLTLNTDVTIKRPPHRSHFRTPHTPSHSFFFSLLLSTIKTLATDYSFALDGMFTNSMAYDQDHRPTKRPRDNGGGEGTHLPNLNINAGLSMENMGMGMGMSMSATGDSFKNTREGRQPQQQQQVSTPPTTTTGNRGRTDDKNNRKLSCKECRRRVPFYFPDELSHWY